MKTWQDKALEGTQGMFHAIVRCALGKNLPGPARRQFHGKASVTSDGFVMCDFTDANGDLRMGAFVGEVSELERNTEGLIKHLKLNPAEATALKAAVQGWIGRDWRASA